ncbi:MAG: YfiR family protein [Bacteroidetes bacterium]|nr:YfiR family protein [Bacteroidota bacterium]
MKKIVGLVGFIFLATIGFGQTQNFQMHTVYMYAFAKFVKWPPEDSQGDFEIAVLGDSPILSELKTMAEVKKAVGRPFKITKINSMTDYKKSHILYISPNWTEKYSEIAAKIGEAPVLLVTEQATSANKGCVNFVSSKEGKLAFEINQEQLSKHKLRAASELMRLAIVN